MATVDVPLERIRFGQTKRRDLWWAMPLTTFIVFTSFVVYVTWALLQGDHYHYGNYLSPLYSPELFGDSPHAIFGPWRWPWLIPFIDYSPAMLILVFPLAFRMTCYYYRGAYYKAFWADPLACAVGEPRNDYRGEAKWPLLDPEPAPLLPVLRAAVHRAAVDRRRARRSGSTTRRPGTPSSASASARWCCSINVVLIGGYTLGCHSFRHLVGGMHGHAVARRPRARRPTTASAASTGTT